MNRSRFASLSATSALGGIAAGAAAATGTPAPTGDPFGTVDPQRQAIQQDLYLTQFYQGRTDGRLGDEDRMTRAIKLVQIAASLPVTGVYNDDVHRAIATFHATGGWTPLVVFTAPPGLGSPGTTTTSVQSTSTFPWRTVGIAGVLATVSYAAWRVFARKRSVTAPSKMRYHRR